MKIEYRMHFRATVCSPGPKDVQIWVSGYLNGFYGHSMLIPFHELPVELMDANEAEFLAHPWTAENLIPEAKAEVMARIETALKEMKVSE